MNIIHFHDLSPHYLFLQKKPKDWKIFEEEAKVPALITVIARAWD